MSFLKNVVRLVVPVAGDVVENIDSRQGGQGNFDIQSFLPVLLRFAITLLSTYFGLDYLGLICVS